MLFFSLRGECCWRRVGFLSSLAPTRYSASTKCYRVSRKVWKYRQSLSIAIVRRKGGTHARWRGIGHHESLLSRRSHAHPFRGRVLSVFFFFFSYLLRVEGAFFRIRRDEIRACTGQRMGYCGFHPMDRSFLYMTLSLSPLPIWIEPMSLVETRFTYPHLYPISESETSLLESA